MRSAAWVAGSAHRKKIADTALIFRQTARVKLRILASSLALTLFSACYALALHYCSNLQWPVYLRPCSESQSTADGTEGGYSTEHASLRLPSKMTGLFWEHSSPRRSGMSSSISISL